MTLILKSTINELWKGWQLAWFHHFTHITCVKNWEGYCKNWMHFVYKMDNLFRSIMVSHENSCVTKGFHFLTYFNSRLFLFQHAPFKSTSSIFNPFWLHVVFFLHSLIFWAKLPWYWKALQMNSQKVESWHGFIITPT